MSRHIDAQSKHIDELAIRPGRNVYKYINSKQVSWLLKKLFKTHANNPKKGTRDRQADRQIQTGRQTDR